MCFGIICTEHYSKTKKTNNMKTISTLITSLFMTATVFAAGKPAAILTVKSATNSNIRVVVDGKTFEPGNSSLKIEQVNAGYHSIAVYRMKQKGFRNQVNNRYVMVYNASLAINPATSVLIMIDRFGKAELSEQQIAGNGYGREWNDREWNDHTGYGDPGKSDGQWDDGRWEDNRSYSGYARAMSDREFDQMVSSLRKEWFEANKMKSVSFIIDGNFFTAAQVKDLMSLFNFENNRLDIAKQAYLKTLDKENYQCVAGALNFSSSREALNRYIRSCK
jgi:hypothetical protein